MLIDAARKNVMTDTDRMCKIPGSAVFRNMEAYFSLAHLDISEKIK